MITPLKDYVADKNQSEAARLAGLTQGSIWQMLKSKRQIFVVDDGDESYLEERKQLGTRWVKPAA